MRYEDWTETKIIEGKEQDEIVDKNENSGMYQNVYRKKEVDDQFSDGELSKME